MSFTGSGRSMRVEFLSRASLLYILMFCTRRQHLCTLIIFNPLAPRPLSSTTIRFSAPLICNICPSTSAPVSPIPWPLKYLPQQLCLPVGIYLISSVYKLWLFISDITNVRISPLSWCVLFPPAIPKDSIPISLVYQLKKQESHIRCYSIYHGTY